MKRIIVLGVAAALTLVIVFLFVRVSEPLSEEAPVDPAMPIHMPDGEVLPLSEAIASLRMAVEESTATASTGSSGGREAEATAGRVAAPHTRPARTTEDPAFTLGKRALEAKRFDEALALFRSVPPTAREYSRAQRLIGWKILTQEQKRPTEGVAYAEAAVFASPFEGNCWQDLGRVYAAAIGFSSL